MRTFQLTCFGVLFFMISSSNCLDAAEHTKDTLKTVKQNVDQNKAVLVDVRELSEWNAGHIKGAQFVPLSRLKKESNQWIGKQIPKGKIVYLHCKSGGRVLIAAAILKEIGYDARPLKQGYRLLIEGPFEKAED